MTIHHLSEIFEQAFAEHAGRPATRIREGENWRLQTFDELRAKVNGVAGGLIARGVGVGDRIGLFANNCPEWTEVDLGCMFARAVPVPLYATSTPDQIKHILADSGTSMIFVGGQSEAERVLEVAPELPMLGDIVVFEPYEGMPPNVTAYADFGQPMELIDRLRGASGDELASIIYTSGTTGAPKGVMITHESLVRQIDAVNLRFHLTPSDHSLCFLPLSHAFERAWTLEVLSNGCMNTYVPNAREVADMMVLAQPTLMVSVPKLFETVFKTAHQKVAGSAVKRAIFTWAFRVGGRLQRAYRKGKTPSPFWRMQLPVADALVFKNIRAAMGGKKTVLASGGAPLRQEIEEFFSAAGLLVCQGYGLTEAGPLISFNSPGGFKFGTTGRVMERGELRIAEFGEICYRGPNVMAGYWNNPEATKETIIDGWLHTGDAGYVDSDGYLVITDRIKDIIVTLGGKNVAPQPIEGLVLADPLFEHAVLLGDNRPSLTLLVRPSMPAVEELAAKLQWPGGFKEWAENPDFLAEVKRRVAELTAKLPSHEQVRDTSILTDEFTMDNGLLTPTLKVKRREVEKRFKDIVEGMYARIADRKKE